VEVVAVPVEELHRPALGGDALDLLARAERLVDHGAAGQVLELGADECAALARLDVLEADDAHQLAVDVQHVAVLQVVGRDHALLSPIVLT
jgi:hypothetical protein